MSLQSVLAIPHYAYGDNQAACEAFAELRRAAATIAQLQSRLDVATDALTRHGYRERCDIPACNCGDRWNHGGHAAERLRELADVLYENGKTPLQVAKALVSSSDRSAER